jgi:hypothetical protein
MLKCVNLIEIRFYAYLNASSFFWACPIIAKSQCWLFALRANTGQISIFALKYPYLLSYIRICPLIQLPASAQWSQSTKERWCIKICIKSYFNQINTFPHIGIIVNKKFESEVVSFSEHCLMTWYVYNSSYNCVGNNIVVVLLVKICHIMTQRCNTTTILFPTQLWELLYTYHVIKQCTEKETTSLSNLLLTFKLNCLHDLKIMFQCLLHLTQRCFMLCTTYTNFWFIVCPLEVRCLTPLSKIPREIHTPVASHWQTLSHIIIPHIIKNQFGRCNFRGLLHRWIIGLFNGRV